MFWLLLLLSLFSALSSSLSPSFSFSSSLHHSPLFSTSPSSTFHSFTYPQHILAYLIPLIPYTSNKMLKNTIVPFSRNTPTLLRAKAMVNKNISTLKVPTVRSQITNGQLCPTAPSSIFFLFLPPPHPFCLWFTKTQPANQPLHPQPHPRWYIHTCTDTTLPTRYYSAKITNVHSSLSPIMIRQRRTANQQQSPPSHPQGPLAPSLLLFGPFCPR